MQIEPLKTFDDKEEARKPLENPLRPRRLEDYIGQESVKTQLRVFINAAKARKEPLDHTLIYGPPGLGKTTLASIISHEFNAELLLSSGPAISKASDVATLLTALKPNHILFIDEIHRLHQSVEELLYAAMEDFRLDIVLGEGTAARSISLPLPPFTLVGATTRAGLLSKPLFDRFGINQHLDFYEDSELQSIVLRSAKIKDIFIEDAAAMEIAKRSRGTPRVANRLLMRVRDFAHASEDKSISLSCAKKAIATMNVDEAGLDKLDQAFLGLLIKRFGGGPTGISSLAVSMNESKDTLEDMIEPFLIRKGYIQRTPRGRIATSLAYQSLSLSPPKNPLE